VPKENVPYLKKHAVRFLLLTCGFLCIFFYVNCYSDAYTDDAFIQLKYADTLLKYGNWGFFPDHVANTATSPLNVVLMALFGFFTRSILDASVLLTALEFLLIFLLLYWISKRLFGNLYFSLFAWVAFATNPLLLSTLGLESVLYLLLLLASYCLFLYERWSLLSVMLGLLTLARADGILLFLILISAARISWKSRLQCAMCYVLVLLPWHLYSWVHLGSLVPDTLFLKMSQGTWGRGITFTRGLGFYYIPAFPIATLSSFALILFGFFALRSSHYQVRRFLLLVAAYGLVHFVAYSILGVPPYHWYYVHLMISCVLIGALGMACVVRRRNLYWTAAIPAVALFLLIRQDGFPLQVAPIHTNWATTAQYREIGLWLRDNTEPSATFKLIGEIGTLSYYSERYLINKFSNRNAITDLVNKRLKESGFHNWVMRANFYWRRRDTPFAARSYDLVHQPFGRPPRDALKVWHTSTYWGPDGKMYLRKSRDLNSVQSGIFSQKDQE